MNSRPLIVLFVLLAASPTNATITFGIQADLLKDSGGVAIAQTSLVMLVASTTNSSFEAINENASSSVNSLLNADDMVVWRGNLSDFGSNGVLDTTSGSLSLSGGWNAGDSLALLWFPTLTLASDILAGGTEYGLYTKASVFEGNPAWVTPSDGTSGYALGFYTEDGGELGSGGNPAEYGNASYTVEGVPEPSASCLTLLGFATAFLRRRRR